MPVVTQITQQKRSPNRRSVFLDGTFAFGCNVNVIARFRLRQGVELTTEQVQQIQQGEIRQECLDYALRLLQMRAHSRAELLKKLQRREYGSTVSGTVLDDLVRLGYLDDARLAHERAQCAASTKHQGRRRAYLELMRAGINADIANRALDEVYGSLDATDSARQFALKQLPRLQRLQPQVARRRLAGMLQRRGFTYEQIKPIVDELLNTLDDEQPADDNL